MYASALPIWEGTMGILAYIPRVNRRVCIMFEYEFRLFNGELLTVMKVPRELSEVDLSDCLLELYEEHQAPIIWALV